MEVLGGEMAEYLHSFETSPYALNVRIIRNTVDITGQKLRLRIAMIGEDLQRKLVDKLQVDELGCLHIKKIDTTLTSVDFKLVKMQPLDEYRQELADVFAEKVVNQAWMKDVPAVQVPSRFKLHFSTPTSFRSSGDYQMMPTPHLILQNLAMRHSTLVDNGGVNGQELDIGLINAFDKAVRISSYNLHSQYMPIEQTKIPGFMGSLILAVNGSNTLKQYVNLLVHFGNTFGCGIKASMGMGAMEHLEVETRDKSAGELK